MKIAAKLIVSLILISFFVFGCRNSENKTTPAIIFDPDQPEIVLSQGQKQFLLLAARKSLAGAEMPDPDPSLKAVRGGGATVEIFLPPQKPVIKVVGGNNFIRALTAALRQAASNSSFRAIIRPRLNEARIKVGVIDRVFEPEFDSQANDKKILRQLDDQIEEGWHGLILALNGKVIYQHPDLVLYNGWGLDISKDDDGENRVEGPALLQRRLEILASEAAGDATSWKTGKLYAFTAQSFIDKFGEPGRPLDGCRGKNPIPPLTSTSLRAAALANADYLVRLVGEDGKLRYHYFPNEDQNDPDYDLTRHAGYVLRLLAAYHKFGKPEYYAAARRAMTYLSRRIVRPRSAPGIALIGDGREAVLGTNALMAMIYSEWPAEDLPAEDRRLRDEFGASILFFRMPTPGLFYTNFQQALERQAPEKQALYFPGIALLALVRLYEQTGEKKWWGAAAQVSGGMKKLWLKEGPRAVGNYCWVGQAWARMARLEKNSALHGEYLSLAYSHADAVLKHQWTPERKGFFPDYLGAADNSHPPRTTPTSSRAESLAENYLTAKFFGDAAAQKKYGVALLQALHFVIQNQFADDNSWFLPYPEKAKGGIRGGLIANDLRIDYNQHALGAELNALDTPDELMALGVTQW